MQKKLIALAIAGLSGAAFAQSNVTIYGVADTTFEQVQATGATAGAASDVLNRSRVTANNSYLGFKGEESLGNGLKAVFQFEANINHDTGATFGGTARDTFVGISGNFGTVIGGQFTAPTRALGNAIEFSPGATGIQAGKSLFGTVNGVKYFDERLTNAIGYNSPSFSGFKVGVAYAAGENRTNTGVRDINGNAWDLGLTYDNGPLLVGLTYTTAKDFSSAFAAGATAGTAAAAGSNTKVTDTRLAAKYVFPSNTTVTALWDSTKTTLDNGTSVDAKRNAWQLGVKQDIGAHSVYAQYTKANALKGSAVTAANNDTDAKQWTLGYSYALSKRTQVRAYYTQITNGSEGRYDFYNSAAGVAAGADPKGYGVGVRHSF